MAPVVSDEAMRIAQVLRTMPYAGAMKSSGEVIRRETGGLDLERVAMQLEELRDRLIAHAAHQEQTDAQLLELQHQRRAIGAFLAGALHDAGALDRLPA